MASMATPTEPSVPFLKPMGKEAPEASSRWSCDSVVRAPIAPQLMRSAINWGLEDRVLDPSREPKLAHIPNSVKELTTDGHTHGVDIAQEFPSHSQTLVDLEGTVDIGVIDETLPPDSRSGLFTIKRHRLASANTFLEKQATEMVVAGGQKTINSQVDSHNDFQTGPPSLLHAFSQSRGVLLGLVDIVDTARTDNDNQSRKGVGTAHDGRGGSSRSRDGLGSDGRNGKVMSKESGRDEGVVLVVKRWSAGGTIEQ